MKTKTETKTVIEATKYFSFTDSEKMWLHALIKDASKDYYPQDICLFFSKLQKELISDL